MPLHVVVPGREVGIADRPIDRHAFLLVGLEVEIAQAIALAAPQQRTSAHAIAAEPVEAFHLRVRRVLLVRPCVDVGLFQDVALEHVMRLFHRIGGAAAMQVFPRRLGGVDVILDVLDVAAALQQQHAQAPLGEFLGGPTARDARADHDRVVMRRTRHQVLQEKDAGRALDACAGCVRAMLS
jgi:hypothetical protein